MLMKEGGSEGVKQQAVRTLIDEQFDGSEIAAMRYLREYFVDSRSSGAAPGAPQPAPRRVASRGPILLSARNLTKGYKRGRKTITVLHNVDVDIYEGEIVAITGASGSGKSTLLQLLGGLDKPTSGEVLYGGKNLAKLSDNKLSEFRRNTVGFVFQFFYLQPFLRLERNLEVPGMFSRKPRRERIARSESLAHRVGLADRLNHFPRELSGGQMQRAAIARALFNQPKILLADEPTGNLDSFNGRAVIDLFETIRRELGTTIVIVTHDPAIAKRADRIIHVRDGVIV